MPLGVVTATSTVPAVLAGVTAVIVLRSTTVKLDTGAPPTRTSVAPPKFTPVMVTRVPPKMVPLVGLIAIPLEPTGTTKIEADAPLPNPRFDATAVVALFFAPTLVAVTLIDTVQDVRGLIATAEI